MAGSRLNGNHGGAEEKKSEELKKMNEIAQKNHQLHQELVELKLRIKKATENHSPDSDERISRRDNTGSFERRKSNRDIVFIYLSYAPRKSMVLKCQERLEQLSDHWNFYSEGRKIRFMDQNMLFSILRTMRSSTFVFLHLIDRLDHAIKVMPKGSEIVINCREKFVENEWLKRCVISGLEANIPIYATHVFDSSLLDRVLKWDFDENPDFEEWKWVLRSEIYRKL